MEDQIDVQLVVDELRNQIGNLSVELAIARARNVELLKKLNEDKR